MKLSREEVLHIARLARVDLSDDEVDKLSEQLSDILDNFEALQQVDTEGVPPTAQSIDLENIVSDDVVLPSLPPEKVLDNAPAKEGDMFKIRAVLEE